MRLNYQTYNHSTSPTWSIKLNIRSHHSKGYRQSHTYSVSQSRGQKTKLTGFYQLVCSLLTREHDDSKQDQRTTKSGFFEPIIWPNQKDHSESSLEEKVITTINDLK